MNGEGGSKIDATRSDVRTGGEIKEKCANIHFVPQSMTSSEQSEVIDEIQVKGQARNPPAPKKKATKEAAQAAPAQVRERTLHKAPIKIPIGRYVLRQTNLEARNEVRMALFGSGH